MILRFSQQLSARLKTGVLKPLPLDSDAVADWTSHLFFFDRTPYILVSNSETLYSTLLYAQGITNDKIFISRVMAAVREFMDADGLAFAYDRFIMPRTGLIRFASTVSRSVTGSMNELIAHAKVLLADDETSPFERGRLRPFKRRLDEMPPGRCFEAAAWFSPSSMWATSNRCVNAMNAMNASRVEGTSRVVNAGRHTSRPPAFCQAGAAA